jgi:hypothetical protein
VSVCLESYNFFRGSGWQSKLHLVITRSLTESAFQVSPSNISSGMSTLMDGRSSWPFVTLTACLLPNRAQLMPRLRAVGILATGSWKYSKSTVRSMTLSSTLEQVGKSRYLKPRAQHMARLIRRCRVPCMRSWSARAASKPKRGRPEGGMGKVPNRTREEETDCSPNVAARV